MASWKTPHLSPKLAWALYDFGNSAFATVMAGFFPIALKRYWYEGDPLGSTFWLGMVNGAASFLVLLIAPPLGAIADQGGLKKRLLLLFALLGISTTASLSAIGPGSWELALLLYGLAVVGFSTANVFYDALLVDIAPEEEYESTSALGFALGYLGGGLLLALSGVVILKPAWFGLSPGGALSLAFLAVALWWLLFLLPLLSWVPESPPRTRHGIVAAGIQQLRTTLAHLRRYRLVLLFLIAYWFYIDGLDTIVRMAVDFGAAIGLAGGHLISALLLVQLLGAPATLYYGHLARLFGTRNAILLGLGVYVVVLLWAFQIETVLDFYLMAAMIALVQGGVQAMSRAYYAHLIPKPFAGEFFGFYNMLGKFAAVLGPPLVGAMAQLTGVHRWGILSVIVLFLIGGAILWRLPSEPRGTANPPLR